MYPGTGAAKADAVIADATTSFAERRAHGSSSTRSPRASGRPTPTTAYVRAFAARMAQTYNKSVIVASPFPKPRANAVRLDRARRQRLRRRRGPAHRQGGQHERQLGGLVRDAVPASVTASSLLLRQSRSCY